MEIAFLGPQQKETVAKPESVFRPWPKPRSDDYHHLLWETKAMCRQSHLLLSRKGPLSSLSFMLSHRDSLETSPHNVFLYRKGYIEPPTMPAYLFSFYTQEQNCSEEHKLESAAPEGTQ